MNTASHVPTPAIGLSSITLGQWMILFMVQLTTLLYGMSITLANVVLPQVKGAMSATQDQIAWVVTFNLVASAVATPLTGWLANRFGWRNTLFFSLVGFTISSFLCGIATNLEFLVAARVGQGAFGATIMPMGQGILLATFPRPLHALVMMMWGMGAVMGPIGGPVLGSMISEASNWRGAFLMVVPPGAIATVLVWFALASHTERRPVRFDWTGFLALAVAIGCAQLIMDRGQRLDWFDSTEIVIEAFLCVVGLWVFIAHSLTASQPFLDPRLLLDRNFAIGLITVFVMGMLSYTPIVLFPGLLNDLRGYPEGLIGLLIAGRGIGNFASFAIVVQATRWNPRLAMAAGLAMQAASGWWMAQLDINLTAADVFWSNALQGFGFGLAFTPMSVLAFATLPRERVTEGMSLFHLVRNFGSSLFISASVVLLIRSTAVNYSVLTEGISHFNKALTFPQVMGQWSLGTPSGLAALSGEIQRQAAMIGYINAFYLFAFAAAAAVPFAWIMRDVPKDG
ncbi:MAG: DHA2 family efflux MFS transporter permease subunit [Hyphomicrobiaceae bacterium]|nr:DHA2 family efflux MFS transporter permease subunit [Hyphomicrobiaceae bacterium]